MMSRPSPASSTPRYTGGGQALTLYDEPNAVPGITRPFNAYNRFEAEVAYLEFRSFRTAQPASADPVAWLNHYWELQSIWGRAPTSAGDLSGSYGTVSRANVLFREISQRVTLTRRLEPSPPHRPPPAWISAENWARRIHSIPQDLTMDEDGAPNEKVSIEALDPSALLELLATMRVHLAGPEP